MKDYYYFFRLSRPLNVLIAALAFGLSCFIASSHQFSFLTDYRFWSALVCIAFITATGYWINDVYDFKIDRINKPRKTIVNAHLSVKKVLTVYFPLQLGVLGLSVFTLGEILTGLNLLTILLLFLYAAWFKRVSVVGNLLIAALTGLVVYYAALLYLPKASVFWTMMFAFEVTFLRELAKDIEDVPGDVQYHLNTLPIQIGIRGAKRVLMAAYLLLIGSCYLPFAEELVRLQEHNWPYLAASATLVQIPAIILLVMLVRAKEPGDFKIQSTMLKALIFGGFIAVCFLK